MSEEWETYDAMKAEIQRLTVALSDADAEVDRLKSHDDHREWRIERDLRIDREDQIARLRRDLKEAEINEAAIRSMYVLSQRREKDLQALPDTENATGGIMRKATVNWAALSKRLGVEVRSHSELAAAIGAREVSAVLVLVQTIREQTSSRVVWRMSLTGAEAKAILGWLDGADHQHTNSVGRSSFRVVLPESLLKRLTAHLIEVALRKSAKA